MAEISDHNSAWQSERLDGDVEWSAPFLRQSAVIRAEASDLAAAARSWNVKLANHDGFSSAHPRIVELLVLVHNGRLGGAGARSV